MTQNKKNNKEKPIKEHFDDFEECFEEKYAEIYGNFRIIRIKEAVSGFLGCGDYHKGIARIKCINADCNHEYFRPFSCKTWYLCPSCHQKRIFLFSEHLDQDVLLKRDTRYH
ncbi:MAG: transposase zinc-binding domain-containing protein [Spirochaetes bacterium]|nr:transposase zinc-binding domain-containing protein [Spirochaetota bacterium]